MIKAERIQIKRSFAFPSFSWLSHERKPADPRSQAERAIANRKREAFANAQRDATQAEYFLSGYRHIY